MLDHKPSSTHSHVQTLRNGHSNMFLPPRRKVPDHPLPDPAQVDEQLVAFQRAVRAPDRNWEVENDGAWLL